MAVKKVPEYVKQYEIEYYNIRGKERGSKNVIRIGVRGTVNGMNRPMYKTRAEAERKFKKLAAFFFPNLETVVTGFKAVSSVRAVPVYY